MILKKNEETDEFTLLVEHLVQNEGGKRKPFVKSPLKPRRLTFFNWLRSIFRFKRDPFSASPFASEIGLSQSTEAKTEDAKARQEVVHQDLDVVNDVVSRLKDYLPLAQNSADATADRLNKEFLYQANILNECRPGNLKRTLLTAFEQQIASLRLVLNPIARERADAEQALDEFRASNGLSRNTYSGEELTTKSALIIGGIVVLEFMLNTIFFAGSNPLGMVGAATIAFLFSIMTILLGVFLGMAFQATHPKNRKRVTGYAAMLGLLVVAGFYLLLLTNARLAGENGELNMFGAAAQMIQTRPFAALLDLPSLAYCFFSIGIIWGVADKYVQIAGRFPGLKPLVQAKRYTEEDFEEEVSYLVTDSQEKGKKCVEALDHLPAFVNGCRGIINDILIDYENVGDQLNQDVDALKSAERVLLGFAKTRLDDAASTSFSLADWGHSVAVKAFGVRLEEKRGEAHALLNQEGISAGEIDRCRNEVLAATIQQVDRLTSEAEKIFDERLEHAHRDHGETGKSRSKSARSSKEEEDD